MLQRVLNLKIPKGQSLFLWGGRKTGKSTYLKEHFPESPYIDFLKRDIFLRYNSNPSLLREELYHVSHDHPIIIDEIQKIPEMLDEVHWMIENYKGISFILCGSSFRKLKNAGANLLGGRAWRQLFFPLCYPELPSFDLLKIFNQGLIPSHYLETNREMAISGLEGYLADYLIPEIQQESRIRQLGAFNRFLEAISYSNGEMLNYSNIARECMISVGIVQLYVDLLIDMLLGYVIFPYTKTKSRQLIVAAPKFYFFDTGLVNFLRERSIETLKGSEAGHNLEHYVFLELMAYRELNKKRYTINYWRTKTGLEVDFILGKGHVALEIKISALIDKSDIRGLIAFTEEYKPTYAAVVCLEPKERFMKVGDQIIHIVPVETFLKNLWAGRVI
ncbi:MAG: ATP-binding protein [Alphaproteobacteria bacterium]|nr:ATP-binding protein [Alphaproteobacteria bacterium]